MVARKNQIMWFLMQKTVGEFTEIELNRSIEMAIEDLAPFETIELQFGLSEREVIKVMRANLKKSSFRLWCKRVNSGVS